MWICEPMKNIQCPCQIQTGNKAALISTSLLTLARSCIFLLNTYTTARKSRDSPIYIFLAYRVLPAISISCPQKKLWNKFAKLPNLLNGISSVSELAPSLPTIARKHGTSTTTCTECSRYRCECKLHSTLPKHFPAILFHIDKPYHSYHSHKPRKNRS